MKWAVYTLPFVWAWGGSLPIRVAVPRINDEIGDHAKLCTLWELTNTVEDYELDFTFCSFLRPNAVAFLGGLAKYLEYQGSRVTFLWDTIRDAVRANLDQNGFCASFGAGSAPWSGNSIPYRQDPEPDKDSLIHYLKYLWVGKGWVNVSPALRDAIVGAVWEIYENAFEHGGSPIGVFTCGQYFQTLKRLHLATIDFGVGIPEQVRTFMADPQYPADRAMEWAFRRGTTTKVDPKASRGIGLDILKSFVQVNQGALDVYSHSGYTQLRQNHEAHSPLARSFEGTLFNISFTCDQRYYVLSSETSDGTLF